VPCVPFVGIGPEQCCQPVARHTPFARRRKDRKQSKPRRSQLRSGRPVVGLDPDATESQEAQHGSR
jgi:hypothetical protein